jgi:hypothetical protein
MKTFAAAIIARGTVVTSAKVAFVVVSIRALITYGGRICLRCDMAPLDWVKLALSYCGPYCVDTYGAVRHAMRHAKDKEEAAARESP